VAGRRPVEEAFVARRPAIRLLVVPQRRAALEKLVLHATNLRIPIVEVEGGSLTALAGFDGHQGVALVVEPRQFASLDDVLARAAERGEPPFILVLDSLEDPHNVGTLLRSAEAAGVHGVLFPTHRQAPLSPSAVKASAGAIEHLLLCPVDDLPGALSDLHTRGVRIAGAEGDAPMTARQSDLRGPLAIVVGSEGQGLGPAVRRRADLFMRIPMKGAVGSLNAAVAGSILLFEALAQRDPNATPRMVPSLGSGGADESAEPAKGNRPAKAAKAKPAPSGPLAPDEPVPDAQATAPAEPKPKPRPRKGLSTEPDDVVPTASDAADATKTTPKRRVRKGLSTEPVEVAPPPSGEAAPSPTVAPKPARRTRKATTTKAADPAEPAAPAPEAETESPDDDLLPSDGPKKRSPRGR
jgi:23S rRNA (guanosine2251-2'-O)-methyltransferase